MGNKIWHGKSFREKFLDYQQVLPSILQLLFILI